ncbi:histidine phosphatase family protein [Saccharothrix deserti]|uniref:histidine phosphatase family protein n=1 Tax=Saccharothrix deserti TaxID=2593674 RepID=UPI00131CA36F|nr:histidine phosphatase family protein [Saccharothrix deserti]
MATDLVLVRHASSVIPTPDGPDEMTRPLTDEGLAQARDLVDVLRVLGPTAVLSSPYLRAVQTVSPTAEALGLTVDTRWDLREWDSGIAPTPDYVRHFAHSWDNPDEARPGGESMARLSARVARVLAEVAEEHDGGVVLIGTHGTFAARALLAAGHAVDWPFLKNMPMPAIYRMRWRDGRPTTAHGPGLPREVTAADLIEQHKRPPQPFTAPDDRPVTRNRCTR